MTHELDIVNTNT